MNELTQWFLPEVKPELAGAYQTCHDTSEQPWEHHGYQYWDGQNWGAYNCSPDDAWRERNVPSAFSPVYWRGLAIDPTGAQP